MNEDPRQLREEIGLLLKRLRAAPVDLALHRQLREAAFRHKAVGGGGLGVLGMLRPAPRDRTESLIHFARAWAFDPANMDHAISLCQAVDAHAGAAASEEIEAVRIWLTQVIRTASAEGGT
jgi:hypothetical protein